MKLREFTEKDYKIHDRKHLDRSLVKLCELVIQGQQHDAEKYGMVAACVMDNDHRVAYGVNTAAGDGKRKHAERVAIEAYESKYGEIPEGSIIITTCSPCNEDMEERYGESCTDLINHSNVRKVYCGYQDPSQHDAHAEYTLEVTSDKNIRGLCKKLADTFLKNN
jgi:pyrimidine deaminase RibD-like protein